MFHKKNDEGWALEEKLDSQLSSFENVKTIVNKAKWQKLGKISNWPSLLNSSIHWKQLEEIYENTEFEENK